MARPACPIQHRSQLRRVEVKHYTSTGQIRRGVLVVNKDVAVSVSRIFTRHFQARFPIRRMQSAEVYNGNNTAILNADDTSAFMPAPVADQRVNQ